MFRFLILSNGKLVQFISGKEASKLDSDCKFVKINQNRMRKKPNDYGRNHIKRKEYIQAGVAAP